VVPVARWLDNELWKILETATGLTIPRQAGGREWDCVLPVPVEGREDRNFQEWVVRHPVRLGGFGLRSLEETAGPAFLAALEQAIPAMSGVRGVCRMLEGVFGGADCFGEDAPEESRWRVMLQSGCQEGQELRTL
jgi:hypothetical protein